MMLIMLIALVPLCGVLLALTPSFMPRSECFTITVPETAQNDPRIKQLKRSYLVIMLGIAAVATVVAAVVVPGTLGSADSAAFTAIYSAAIMVPVVVGFILMLMYRGRVMRIKEEEGWKSQTQLSATVVADGSAPEPLRLAWNLLYVPVFIITAVLLYVLYPLMPEQIPMQVSFTGEVTSFVDKTPVTVSFPLFVNLFVAAIMVFTNWSIGRSKRPVDPKKPASSAYAYGAFAKVQSVLLLAMGLSITGSIGVLFPLASAGIISLGFAGMLITAITVVIVIVVMVVSLKMGQSGARVFEGAADSEGMSRDEDRFWKLGVFYVNSQDPSVFVPKRFGFGWTINFGSPLAWLLLIGLIAVIAGFAVASIVLFG